MFEDLIGNEGIKAYLTKGLQTNTLPHALVFSGLSGLGKSLFAKHLSASFLSTTPEKVETHPDFHALRPESKSGLHAIDTLRLMIDEVHKVSFEGTGKVFVIYDAHKMQTASANAILKTLEEPSPDTTLILITEHANEMLPTIRSRCAHLEFKPIEESLIAAFLKSKGYDELLAKLSFGSIGKAIALSSKPPQESALFTLLSQRLSYPNFLRKIEEVEALVESDDPTIKNQNIERVLETILMWYRDQHAQKAGISKERLFSPEEPASKGDLPPMEKIITLVDQARLGIQRNIRLSVCLESLLSRLS